MLIWKIVALLIGYTVYLYAAYLLAEQEFSKGEDRRKKREDYQDNIRKVEEFKKSIKRRNHG